MKATKVDGIYDKDPVEHKDAKRYRAISFKDAIEMDDVQVMDTAALAMSKDNNMPVMVFELFRGENLIKAVAGDDIGTYVSNDVTTELI